jgi:hypothetical protein
MKQYNVKVKWYQEDLGCGETNIPFNVDKLAISLEELTPTGTKLLLISKTEVD